MQHHDSLMWDNVNFPNKIREDEDIHFIVRQDVLFVLARGIALFTIVLVMLFVRVYIDGLEDSLLVSLYDSFFYCSNILLLVSFLLYFHNYYLSLQIVTSQRIIDIDQKGLFSREVNEMPLANIEDVSYKQDGFWATIFNFGNVILQTAGTGNSNPDLEDSVNGFTFNQIPKPSETCNIITKLYQHSLDREVREAAHENAKAMHSRSKKN
jgi:hypothetical protein